MDREIDVNNRLTNWHDSLEIDRIATESFGQEWRRDRTRRTDEYSEGVNYQFLMKAEATHDDGRTEMAGFAIIQPMARTVRKRHHYLSSTTAELTYLAVQESLRSQGIGSALLAEAEEQARNDGYGHIVVGCRPNETAFFERSGYKFGLPGEQWIWHERPMEPVDRAPAVDEELSTWYFEPVGQYTTVGRKELRRNSVVAARGRIDDRGEAEQALVDLVSAIEPIKWETRRSVHF